MKAPPDGCACPVCGASGVVGVVPRRYLCGTWTDAAANVYPSVFCLMTAEQMATGKWDESGADNAGR